MAEAKKYIFEKLTPVTDSDISVYESAIDFVFDNDDVKNIALSGAYGAGKSSVLASYKSSHPSTKFLHISLGQYRTTATIRITGRPFCKNQLGRPRFCSQERTDSSCQAGSVSQNQIR